MFTESETKRIRRTDLTSPPPSAPASPSLPALKLDLEFVAPSQLSDPADDSDASTDQDLFFPLFSGAAPQRLTLRSPTPGPAEEDLWDTYAHSRTRPLSHYILTPSQARHAEILASAISGSEVLKDAEKGWPATAARCEWKVTHFSTSENGELVPVGGEEGAKKGRKQPGKRRRWYLREARKREEEQRKAREEKARVIMEKQEANRKKQLETRGKFAGLKDEEKEKAEREEKARKNREKKLKKRMKEKEKKMATGGVATKEVEDKMEE